MYRVLWKAILRFSWSFCHTEEETISSEMYFYQYGYAGRFW